MAWDAEGSALRTYALGSAVYIGSVGGSLGCRDSRARRSNLRLIWTERNQGSRVGWSHVDDFGGLSATSTRFFCGALRCPAEFGTYEMEEKASRSRAGSQGRKGVANHEISSHVLLDY